MNIYPCKWGITFSWGIQVKDTNCIKWSHCCDLRRNNAARNRSAWSFRRTVKGMNAVRCDGGAALRWTPPTGGHYSAPLSTLFLFPYLVILRNKRGVSLLPRLVDSSLELILVAGVSTFPPVLGFNSTVSAAQVQVPPSCSVSRRCCLSVSRWRRCAARSQPGGVRGANRQLLGGYSVTEEEGRRVERDLALISCRRRFSALPSSSSVDAAMAKTWRCNWCSAASAHCYLCINITSRLHPKWGENLAISRRFNRINFLCVCVRTRACARACWQYYKGHRFYTAK